jgi:hypothetical protein
MSTSITEYSARSKLGAIERELKYRRRVFPRWVEEGRMTDGLASSQIAIFEAIADDYRALAAKERLI